MQEVAVIFGAGPGTSLSCAKKFVEAGFKVMLAARRPDKPEILAFRKAHEGVGIMTCDAVSQESVEAVFSHVEATWGLPNLVVHNIDGRVEGIFRKEFVDAPANLVEATVRNSAMSAFVVGQAAAGCMLRSKRELPEALGTIIFTNASAAFKGFPKSAAFAMACHAKAGLAQSMARELWPQGIHVCHVPIDGAIGRRQPDGTRAHWLAGTVENENMLDPDEIAEAYLQLHRQPRSTWSFEVTLRPWMENW